MRLLDRYLLRELLMPLIVCLGGFLVFWVAFDLLGDLDDLNQQRVTFAGVAELYWIRLPELLLTVLPFALLLALLYGLTQHGRHNELTAMRAAGVSLVRICAPYFGVGLLGSFLLYALNEIWMPDAKEREEQLRQSWVVGVKSSAQQWRPKVDFWNQTENRSWSLGAFNPVTEELRQPRVAMFLPEGAHRIVTADGARWIDGYWRLTNGVENLFRYADDPVPAIEPRSMFRAADMGGGPDMVSRWDGATLLLTNAIFTNGFLLRTNLRHSDADTGREWSLNFLRPDTGEAGAFSFRAPLGKGARRLIFAESGIWTDGSWTFRGVREFLYRSATDDLHLEQVYPELVLPELTESPEVIRSELRVGSILNSGRLLRRPQLGSREIQNYQRLHPQLPAKDRAILETQLQSRYAGPWTCVVVVLIAIPFGAQSGRRNVFYGVAGSLAIAFAYFVLQRLGFALGQGGQVPPWLGAWLPNLLFTVVGSVLIARVR